MGYVIALTQHGGLTPGKAYFAYQETDELIYVYPTYAPKPKYADCIDYDMSFSTTNTDTETQLRQSAEHIAYTVEQVKLLFVIRYKLITIPIPENKRVLGLFNRSTLRYESLYHTHTFGSDQAIRHLACIDAYLSYMGTSYYAKFGYSLALLCENVYKASEIKDQNAIDLAVQAVNDLFDTLNPQIGPLLILEAEKKSDESISKKKQEQDAIMTNIIAVSSFYSNMKSVVVG